MKIKSFIKDKILEKSKFFWILQGVLDDNALVFFANLHPVLFCYDFQDDLSNVLRKDSPHFYSFEISFRNENSLFVFMVDSCEKNLFCCMRIEEVPFVDVLSKVYTQRGMNVNTGFEIKFEPDEQKSFLLFGQSCFVDVSLIESGLLLALVPKINKIIECKLVINLKFANIVHFLKLLKLFFW
jgi:hypothetical protein